MQLKKVIEPTAIQIVEMLANTIWNEHFTPIIGKEQVAYMLNKFQSFESISQQIKQGFLYFLIQNDKQFIGYIGVQPKEDALLLSKFYILSSERKKGYGKQALSDIETLALSKGLEQISLTVNKYNIETIKAYEKLGFEKIKSIIQEIGHGFIMDDYLMVKKLTVE